MISAQTHFCVCRDGKSVPTPDHALGCPAKISCSRPPWVEVTSALPPARPSRFRCGHPLSKLLKLRSHFEELENPSAQNSRTVKNLTAATHGLLQYGSTPIHK